MGSGGCGQPCLGAWARVRCGGCGSSAGADQRWRQDWEAPAPVLVGREDLRPCVSSLVGGPRQYKAFSCGKAMGGCPGSSLQGPGVLSPCPLGQGFLAKVSSLLPYYFEDLSCNSSREQLCSWASLILNNYAVCPVTVCMPHWARDEADFLWCDYITVSTIWAYPAHRVSGPTAVKMSSFCLLSWKPVLPIKYASALLYVEIVCSVLLLLSNLLWILSPHKTVIPFWHTHAMLLCKQWRCWLLWFDQMHSGLSQTLCLPTWDHTYVPQIFFHLQKESDWNSWSQFLCFWSCAYYSEWGIVVKLLR